MVSNLTAWHVIIIGVIVLAIILAVVVVIVVITRRPKGVAPAGTGAYAAPGGDASARLTQLTDLRDSGQITEAEYEARRRQIVDGL